MEDLTISVIHEAAKETRQRRIAAGLCATCGVNPLKTTYACVACAERQAAYAREHRAKRREEFLAEHGGMDGRELRNALAPEPTVKRCRVCREYLPVEAFSWNDKKAEIRRTICKTCDKKRSDEWQKKNPDKRAIVYRTRHLKRTYGITDTEYATMLAEQNGACAICHTPEKEATRARLCVDHCHESRRIRGLLCFDCNIAIGNLNHDVGRLNEAIRYLSKLPLEK